MQWVGSALRADLGVSRGGEEKVQKCKAACGLCKGANVKTFSGPRSRPSGLWYGLSGTGAGTGKIQVLNLYPNLSARTRLPTAET